MNIVSLKYARDNTLSRYFTGAPCKYGHICERYTASRGCVTCSHDRSNKWVKNNRGKLNKDLIAIRSKKYYEKTSGYYAAKSRERKAKIKLHYSLLPKEEKFEINLLYSITRLLDGKWHVDHIIPLSKGGLHHPNNLQIIPAWYNQWKKDKIL